MNAIKTTHNLDFEAAPWPMAFDGLQMAYRVGTCHGIYCFQDGRIDITVINNDEPGNGHLEDVFEWFEFSARTNKMDLYILAFFNQRFKKHCIEKRGYSAVGRDDVYKVFSKPEWTDDHGTSSV